MGIICLFLIESCLEIAALCQGKKKSQFSLKLHMNSFWLQKTEIKINSSCCLRTALLQERRTQCRYCRTGGFPAQSWRGKKQRAHLRLLGRQLRNCKFQKGVKEAFAYTQIGCFGFSTWPSIDIASSHQEATAYPYLSPLVTKPQNPAAGLKKGQWLKSGFV